MPRSLICLSAFLVAALASSAATAADIMVMISAGFFQVYAQLGPTFEKSTGHKLVTTRGPSVGDSPEAIPTRLTRGEEADVVIMDGHGVDILDQRGLARPNSRIPLAESFIDNVDRLAFDNWAEHHAIHPGGKAIAEMPYPRAKARRQLPRLLR